MRRFATTSAILVSALALSGCGSSGIFDRDRPDEFAVSRAAPLVVPPDFALAPPRPGAPRPQQSNTQAQVLEALFGGPAARSAVESAVTRAMLVHPKPASEARWVIPIPTPSTKAA